MRVCPACRTRFLVYDRRFFGTAMSRMPSSQSESAAGRRSGEGVRCGAAAYSMHSGGGARGASSRDSTAPGASCCVSERSDARKRSDRMATRSPPRSYNLSIGSDRSFQDNARTWPAGPGGPACTSSLGHFHTGTTQVCVSLPILTARAGLFEISSTIWSATWRMTPAHVVWYRLSAAPL